MDYQNPYVAPQTDIGMRIETPEAQRSDLTWLLFSFEGRIPRRTYWGVNLLMGLVTALIFGVVVALTAAQTTFWILFLLLLVPMYWISFAVSAKRWHDRDKSGWWQLIGLVPYIGGIWILIECGCLRGTVGPNMYGHDPT
jgi:uncharacterized membrane protein YhaH (DUF805 family)